AFTAIAVVLGMAALGWMRPRRVGITSPQVMLLLGAAGMAAGIAIDARATPLAAIASICSSSPRSLWAMMVLHAQLLPWMHAGMWAGGFMAVPLLRRLRPNCRRQYCARIVQNLACSAWMTAGMSVGVLAAAAVVSGSGVRAGAAPMLAGMGAGMVWGMVASVALYRIFFLATDAPHAPAAIHPNR
ncbi:MAG TPA: hypothetical protein VFJ62_02450, partial [Usitatibacter sp.]|nr:hypothetical protein [Usitatibacter sp.]